MSEWLADAVVVMVGCLSRSTLDTIMVTVPTASIVTSMVSTPSSPRHADAKQGFAQDGGEGASGETPAKSQKDRDLENDLRYCTATIAYSRSHLVSVSQGKGPALTGPSSPPPSFSQVLCTPEMIASWSAGVGAYAGT